MATPRHSPANPNVSYPMPPSTGPATSPSELAIVNSPAARSTPAGPRCSTPRRVANKQCTSLVTGTESANQFTSWPSYFLTMHEWCIPLCKSGYAGMIARAQLPPVTRGGKRPDHRCTQLVTHTPVLAILVKCGNLQHTKHEQGRCLECPLRRGVAQRREHSLDERGRAKKEERRTQTKQPARHHGLQRG
jgi:hypothetical protein